ncbi:TRAP transporter substrate-binding protein [uncultured Treponema sp.]|uniref:TRAP transporter substrate-binding protein n=1 Tax=uncultured Treponema sp. TaxID=162155 RepID=UPI0025D7E9BC|nr:TRAP transporter substrate-binding protein [uncultured Treponema sp.]
MLRKHLLLSASFLSIISLISCNEKNAKDIKEITLVMAEVNPDDTIAGQMDHAFKEKVEELSGGKIKIDLHCSGILGDVDSVMELMLKPNSTIQIHRMSAVNMAMYNCKKTSLLSVPFTFSSRNHFWKFADSETAAKILNEPLEAGLGLRGLFFGEEGFRHFFSTKKITKVEDFKGLNVRGTNDKAMQGMIAGLQANSVAVNYADLYPALQTGLIDAAEQPIANYLANYFYSVAPYMILDGHTLGVMETIITEECWSSLSKEQQRILIEAGKYASEYCRKISQTKEDKVKKELLAAGATLTSVTDIEPWQKACEKVIKEGSAQDFDLYREILNYAKHK